MHSLKKKENHAANKKRSEAKIIIYNKTTVTLVSQLKQVSNFSSGSAGSGSASLTVRFSPPEKIYILIYQIHM